MSNLTDATNGVKRQISISFAPTITANVRTFTPVSLSTYGELAGWITSRVWSPIIYKKNQRNKDNFLSASWLAFDVDEGLTLEQTIAMIKEWEVFAMIGTTRNHRKDKVTAAGKVSPACDRFRVIFKMSYICTDLEEFEYNVRLYLDVLYSDGSCKDGARLFFPCEKIVFMNEGSALDWQKPPVKPVYQTQKKRATQDTHKRDETIPLWVIRKIEDGVPPGVAGKPGRHSAAYTCAWELADLGYTFDEIVAYVLNGPLAEIGEKDVRHQVKCGVERSRKRQVAECSEESQREREANPSPEI